MPKENSEKIPEDVRLTLRLMILGTETSHSNAKTNTRNRNSNKTPANGGERRDSDFQNYHIIITAMSRIQQQQQQNHKVYEETGKDDSFEEKKKSTESVPERDIMADNDFKTTVSKRHPPGSLSRA